MGGNTVGLFSVNFFFISIIYNSSEIQAVVTVWSDQVLLLRECVITVVFRYSEILRKLPITFCGPTDRENIILLIDMF